MSDLSDAVFSGQLMGHVIAGEELTTSLIADAARNAELASNLVASPDGLSSMEQSIIEAKTAQHTLEDGGYSSTDILADQLDAELAADLTNNLFV